MQLPLPLLARVRADPPVRPPAADAARLAEFLRRHPGWSALRASGLALFPGASPPG
jgi:hypothetical protein